MICIIKIMLLSVIESAVHTIETVFAHEVGTAGFNIMLGICVLTWVFVARVFMAMFSTKRGIVAAFFALAVPMTVGLLAYGMAALYAVPLVDQDWASSVIPWTAFGLFVLLAVLVIGKRIWDLSVGVSVFIYIVATAAAVGAYFCAQATMGVIELGEEQVEQREQRTQDGLDQLL
jgi:hypothetical protein